MMTRNTLRTITLLLALFTTALFGGRLAADALVEPLRPAKSPVVLVTIVELSAIGPDGSEVTLFEDPTGYVTTLDGLGRIGSQISGRGLADGAYHTLSVRLKDEYSRLGTDGTAHRGSLSDLDKPLQLRIRGMIMVESGTATPMRMFEEASYYGYPEGYRGGDDDDD